MLGAFDAEEGAWIEPYHSDNPAFEVVSGKKLKTQKWQYQDCGYITSQKPPRYGDQVLLKVKLAAGNWKVVVEGRSSHIGGRCKLTLDGVPFGSRICTYDEDTEPDESWDMGDIKIADQT